MRRGGSDAPGESAEEVVSTYEHDLLHFGDLTSLRAYRAEMDRLSAAGWEPIGPPQAVPRVGMVEIYQGVRRRIPCEQPEETEADPPEDPGEKGRCDTCGTAGHELIPCSRCGEPFCPKYLPVHVGRGCVSPPLRRPLAGERLIDRLVADINAARREELRRASRRVVFVSVAARTREAILREADDYLLPDPKPTDGWERIAGARLQVDPELCEGWRIVRETDL